MRLCVVVPVYNESETIGVVVDSIRRKDLDIVVVNDGSTDESGRIAEQHGAVVIHHDTKHGKGFSLRRGFQYALEHGYDGVIAMDGDGQHEAEDIEKIIRLAHEHPFSIVNGCRMTDPKGMPLVRRLTNQVMSAMISCVCRQKIADTQCGYRYISANILRGLSFESCGYEIETEVLIKACRAGYPVFSIPIHTIYSGEKSKICPIKDTARFLKYFLKAIMCK